MIGVTRGVSTLVAAAVAGILLWFSTQVGTEGTGEYWATYGLIAAAGLTMALSQIVGGWTKWGWPRFSAGVFLLGFLPVLAVGGWILLARQPADWMNTSNWSRDLGVYGVVQDLGNVLPAIAFGIGLVFGYSFDTAGPRRAVVERDVEQPVAAPAPTRATDERVVATHRDVDEPLTAEQREAAATSEPPTVHVGGLNEDDHDDDDRPVTTTTTRTEREDR